jgi:hypothetical protein
MYSSGSRICPSSLTRVITKVTPFFDVRLSYPSRLLWFGSEVRGCALRLWSRGLNVSLCGGCLYPPFLYYVLFGITCWTPTSSFWRSSKDLHIRYVTSISRGNIAKAKANFIGYKGFIPTSSFGSKSRSNSSSVGLILGGCG